MKNDSYKPYLHWGITAFCVVALSILFFFSLFKLDLLVQFFTALGRILAPFVYGGVVAYLLAPVFNFTYGKLAPALARRMMKPTRAQRLAKGLSTAVSILLAVFLVAALLSLVLPQVVSSVVGLLESNLLPQSIQKASDWLENALHSNPELETIATHVYEETVSALTTWMKTDMLPQLTNLMSGLLNTLTVVKNLLIGLIIAVYLLNSKEHFSAQAKKLLYSCARPKHANLILDNVRFTNQVFGGFISGKLLDSLIIGILCFLGMTLLGMPYTMLISVVIGVTNIIPFFGPFIGAIPCGLLILLIDPLKALYFVLFIVVLQQFDGNILGPKILSNSTGLSSFWVMFAILVAGGLFGFVGMVVGVPVFAVVYSILAGLVNHSLRKKGLPDSTLTYYDLLHIDPQTGAAVYADSEEKKSTEQR